MIYLISYDLKTPGKDYGTLFELLKSASGWWHYLESTWIISTKDALQTWMDKLQKVIDKNDSFLLVDITKQQRNGWLEKKAWEWLKNHDG